MSPSEQNEAIGEFCGVQPEIVEWCCQSPDGDSICMSSEHKHECEEWLARLPEGSWAKNYKVSPLHRYPNYYYELHYLQTAEMLLSDQQKARQIALICGDPPTPLGFPQYTSFQVGKLMSATTHQRTEALLRAIGKWKEEPEA